MVLQNFLCCFELETGGIFLGWFGIVTSVLQLIGSVYHAIFIDEEIKAFEEVQERQYGVSNAAGYKIQIATIRIFLVVWAVIAVLKLLASTSLLNGTMTRNHKKLRYYLILDGIFLGFIMLFVMFLAPLFLLCFPFAIFPVYLTACIYALYKKFENESKGIITNVTSPYGQRQGFAHQQPQVYYQPQGFQQPQAFYQPQGYPPQPHPQTHQQTQQLEDASGLPSYDFLKPSKTQIE